LFYFGLTLFSFAAPSGAVSSVTGQILCQPHENEKMSQIVTHPAIPT
jgi:hypothetical protein